ncbi:putative aldo-keto reductase [Lophium mytilinum]|uniref:Putative aldo-keto reductase n=1 Tax=Lophium mytilinum TaxID=390894 RepID=A0A6A6QHM0_9PEZI|nr:putative aldo-keto reductase [Lophium mytilinum]
MSLPTAPLGKGGPQVPRLGFGLMGLSAYYGTPKPDTERFAVLDKAYELGYRFWDSADVYNDNEDMLGKYFAKNPDRRANIFLATKFAAPIKDSGHTENCSSPEYAKQACARSLKRLGVDHIDLYYVHRLDRKTPIEKTVQALAELKAEGKIRHLGLSECSAESLRRAHAVHPITAVQLEYSPFALDIEDPRIGLLATARELGVAVVAYSPIGRGILSGAIKSRADFGEGDFRAMMPRFSEENFDKNFKLVDQILEVAKDKGVTGSQITLAWLLSQGDDVFPIPGTTNVARVEENVASLKIKLSEQEAKRIRDASEAAEVHGERYPPAMVSALFADTPPL